MTQTAPRPPPLHFHMCAHTHRLSVYGELRGPGLGQRPSSSLGSRSALKARRAPPSMCGVASPGAKGMHAHGAEAHGEWGRTLLFVLNGVCFCELVDDVWLGSEVSSPTLPPS